MIDLLLYVITVGKITDSSAGTIHIYRRQIINSTFIPRMVTNLIEPKMWPLCMAGSLAGGGHPWIHEWPGSTVCPE